jgi:hypothetical protein
MLKIIWTLCTPAAKCMKQYDIRASLMNAKRQGKPVKSIRIQTLHVSLCSE